MTLSDNALTTLENVKNYLQIAALDTSNDDFLIEQINAISDGIQRVNSRQLGLQTYTNERLSGSGRLKQRLNHYPIVSITEILIDDVEYTDYEIFKASSGLLYSDCVWPKCSRSSGMSNHLIESKLNIKATYDAGYVLPKDDTVPEPRTLPWDIEMVVKQLVSSAYNSAGSEGLESFGISDVKWDWSDNVTNKQSQTISLYKNVRV